MKNSILLFICIGLFVFFGFQNYQNSKDLALMDISSVENQEMVKFNN